MPKYLTALDRNEVALGYLPKANNIEVRERLNGEALLSFELPYDVEESAYLELEGYIKHDSQLYVIKEIEQSGDGRRTLIVRAVHVYIELLDDYIDRVVELFGVTATQALTEALQGTTFSVGTVAPTELHDIDLSEKSSLKAVQNIREKWNCDLWFDNRTVHLGTRGTNKGVEIRYGKNLKSLRKPSSSKDVITRLYPYGKDGLTIEGINGGVKYIDSDQITNYKRPKKAEKRWNDIADANELKAAAQKYLNENDSVRVSYQIDFIELEKMGYSSESISVGDTITVTHIPFDLQTIGTRVVEYSSFPYEKRPGYITLSSYVETSIDDYVEMKRRQREFERYSNKRYLLFENVATNFNTRNDRISTTPANPVVATDGTETDHTVNTDGSVDMSFEWLYDGTGEAYDIDGFLLYTKTNADVYENIDYVRADKRAVILRGVPADLTYTFRIQAYRYVDNDIEPSGVIRSNIVSAAPYQPSTEVSFNGNVTGFVGGSTAATVRDNASNAWGKFSGLNNTLPSGNVEFNYAGSTAKGGNATDTDYVNGRASTTVLGDIDKALSDAATAQSTADGKITTFYQTTAPTSASDGDLWFDTDDGNRIYVYDGVNLIWKDSQDSDIASAINSASNAQSTADKKVQTYFSSTTPTAESIGDLWYNTTNYDFKRWDGTSWNLVSDVTGQKTANNTNNVGNQSATTVQDVTINFNTRNDRNATTPNTPVIATDLTAVDHTINDDSSSDISFQWSFDSTGDAGNIDGFIVFIHQSSSSTAYSFGTTVSNEQVYYVSADKRELILYGVPSNKFYTFGVQAYRIVDQDVNTSGVLKSPIVKPSATSENPYQPSSSIAFGGDIIGTIGGTPYDEYNKNPSTVIVASESTSINPKKADFVVPTGSTSAQTVINQAINSITANGISNGRVVIMEGTYVCDNSIICYDSLSVNGQGVNTRIEAYSDTVKLFVNSDTVNGNKNISISDLNILTDVWWDSATGSAYGIEFNNVDFVSISRCKFDNIKYPLRLINGKSIIFSLNQVNNFYEAVFLDKTEDSNINNNTFTRNRSDDYTIAIYLVSSNDNLINGNTIKNADKGIRIEGSHHNSIIGNNSNNNLTFGINLAGSNFNKINGNGTIGNGREGIYLTSSSNNTVQGNTITDNGTRKNLSFNNITITNGSDSNNIQSNTIRRGADVKETGVIDNVYSPGHFRILGDFAGSFDGEYNEAYFEMTSGGASGQTGTISNFLYIDDGTAEVYLYSSFTTTPSVGDYYAIKVYPKYGLSIATTDCDNNIVTNNDMKGSGYNGNFSDSGSGTVTTSQNIIN